MCETVKDMINESRQEGKVEGKAEGKIQILKELVTVSYTHLTLPTNSRV